VPASLITSLIAGLIMGLVSQRLGFALVVGLYGLLGLGYGVVCWKLARAGYIPFPEEE